MKIVINLLLLSWLVIYLLLCVSYLSILNPFQWIIDFSSYREAGRNLLVFVFFPAWVAVAVTAKNLLTNKE